MPLLLSLEVLPGTIKWLAYLSSTQLETSLIKHKSELSKDFSSSSTRNIQPSNKISSIKLV